METVTKANDAYIKKNDEEAVKNYKEAIKLGANLLGTEHV